MQPKIALSTHPLALNDTQQTYIRDTLVHYFDDIKNLPAARAYQNLLMLLKAELTEEDKASLETDDTLDCIEFIRKILEHPHPQNRSVNYPYFGEPRDPDMVIYKTNDGRAAQERKGLLNLTAFDRVPFHLVTKEAVVRYIYRMIIDAVNELAEKHDFHVWRIIDEDEFVKNMLIRRAPIARPAVVASSEQSNQPLSLEGSQSIRPPRRTLFRQRLQLINALMQGQLFMMVGAMAGLMAETATASTVTPLPAGLGLVPGLASLSLSMQVAHAYNQVLMQDLARRAQQAAFIAQLNEQLIPLPFFQAPNFLWNDTAVLLRTLGGGNMTAREAESHITPFFTGLHRFTRFHMYALRTLISDAQLSLDQALTEIAGLSNSQVNVLSECYGMGIRRSHILSLPLVAFDHTMVKELFENHIQRDQLTPDEAAARVAIRLSELIEPLGVRPRSNRG